MRKLVQPFIVLERPLACFQVFNDEREKAFVSGDDNDLTALKASTTGNLEKSFNLDQGFPSNVLAASRAISKDFLEIF